MSFKDNWPLPCSLDLCIRLTSSLGETSSLFISHSSSFSNIIFPAFSPSNFFWFPISFLLSDSYSLVLPVPRLNKESRKTNLVSCRSKWLNDNGYFPFSLSFFFSQCCSKALFLSYTYGLWQYIIYSISMRCRIPVRYVQMNRTLTNDTFKTGRKGLNS